MDVQGAGHVETFGPEDEGAHPAGTGEWWNESVWLQFADRETGVFGALRIGHQPNFHDGVTSIWCMMRTPEWTYKRDGLQPFDAGRDVLANGLAANGTHRFSFDGRCHWSVHDEDIEVDLVSEDFHTPIGFTPGEGMENIARNHFEAAGKISGSVSIKGRKYVLVDGLAYRDHSWGIRYWHHIRVHRFTAANFGPDFSCNAIAIYNETDQLMRWGYVRRGNTIFPAREVDILTYLEADGVSNRGGEVALVLEDGERVEVRFEPIDKGLISRQHGFYINDTIAWAHCAGRVGAAVFETSNNVQGGTIIPAQRSLVRAIVDNGITPTR